MPHGKATDIRLDNSGDVLTDISTLCDNVDFPEEIQASETTGFQPTGDARTYVVGLRGATISLGGKWSATLDAHLNGVRGTGDLDFQYGPAGPTTGNPQYTGKCMLTSYQVTTPFDGPATFSAQLQITGAVTRGTY